MKKVSEVLNLAIPRHATAKPRTYNSSGICFVLNDLQQEGLICEYEKDQAKAVIYAQCQHKGNQHGWLSLTLKAKKKASNLAARVAFYQRLVAKLEKQGK